jgi:hypothetical protein
VYEEMRGKEQLAAEVQATVQLLAARFQAKENEVITLQEELRDATHKVHEAHRELGKRDNVIGTLSARMKALESHHPTPSGSSYLMHMSAAAAAGAAASVSRPLFMHSTGPAAGINSSTTSIGSAAAVAGLAPSLRIHSSGNGQPTDDS